MNNRELRDNLLAEVPAAAPGYWNRIDDSLASAASTTTGQVDLGPLDITAPDPAPRRRLPRWPVVAAAAAVIVLAGWLVSTRVLFDDQAVTTGFADDPLSLPREFRPGPRQNRDHWHAVYGVWDCTADDGNGDWVPAFQSNQDDTGIHSHRDGMIYIHPFFEYSAEENATFSHFESEMHLEVTTTAITLDDGTELRAGVTCNGEPAVVHMRRWEFDLDVRRNPDLAPRVVLKDFGAERFYNDREVWTIALAPLDADIPLPPSERFDELDVWLGGAAIDTWLASLGPSTTAHSVPFGNIYMTAQPGLGGGMMAEDLFRQRLAQADRSPDAAHTTFVAGTLNHGATLTSGQSSLDVFTYRLATDNESWCFGVLSARPDEQEGVTSCSRNVEAPLPFWSQNEFTNSVHVVGVVEQPAVWMVVVTENGRRVVSQVVDGVAYGQWSRNSRDPAVVTLLDAELNTMWSYDDFSE